MLWIRGQLRMLAAAACIATLGACASAPSAPPQLAAEDLMIPSSEPGISLFVRNKRPAGMNTFSADKTVLFIHGLTFPSESTFDLEVGGTSWMDYIARQGYDVYLVDVRGYGRSTRPAANPVTAVGTGELDAFDPTAGWHHVALVFDGSFVPGAGGSIVGIYVDGQVQDSEFAAGLVSSVNDPDGQSTIYVGPNDPAGSDDPANAVLVLDEIAVSDVMRTEAEVRRDAYVEPPDDGFGPWPAGIILPLGLDATKAKWPTGVTYTTIKRQLGRDLFQAKILSGTGTTAPTWGNTSCATCHEPANNFAESQQFASKFGGGLLVFNTPTVLNSAFGTHKFFDGRVPHLEAQVPVPIAGVNEMNLPITEALNRLNTSPDPSPSGATWLARFQSAYGGPATQANLQEVLALYQRTLNSGRSKFDKDLSLRKGLPGGQDVLSAAEKRGRALFFGKARCFGCHAESALSDLA